MPKTRKIQVTLEEEEYDNLAQMARREGKKLAAIVRDGASKTYALFLKSRILGENP